MRQSPRYIPPGGAFVEVTCRTVQSRNLLRPSRRLNDLIGGVLGRAYAHQPVGYVGGAVLSNHLHLYLVVEDSEQLSRFMRYVNTNLAKEINRLHGRTGPVWARRYRAIPVTEEDRAQVRRLRYMLAQGVKENLVARVRHWPGIHSGKDLAAGLGELSGTWFDRTRQSRARHRGKELSDADVAETYSIPYVKLPCWQHLGDEAYAQEIRDLVREVEEEAEAERLSTGSQVLGRRAVLAQHPESVPRRTERSPAPSLHAASEAARIAFYEAYGWFLETYRRAAERLRRGDPRPMFPNGCFPPGLPYVRDGGAVPPG